MLNKKTILLILISLFLISCRTAPVMNITNASIDTSSGKTPSLTNIAQGIVRAGNGLGWQIKKEKPGHSIGTLYLRKHMVKVDINYSQTEFSINYKDSSEMGYDGTNIHSNYNSWVQNLSNAIKAQVYNQN